MWYNLFVGSSLHFTSLLDDNHLGGDQIINAQTERRREFIDAGADRFVVGSAE